MPWYLCTAHRFYLFLLFGKTAAQRAFFMRQKRSMWHPGQESTETIRNRRRALGHVWRSLSRRFSFDYEQFRHFFFPVRMLFLAPLAHNGGFIACFTLCNIGCFRQLWNNDVDLFIGQQRRQGRADHLGWIDENFHFAAGLSIDVRIKIVNSL